MRRLKLNTLDRVIGYFNPERGLRRGYARGVLSTASGYIGARRDRNATSQWTAISASPDADTLPDLETLRARSYDLVRNDPLAQSAVATKVVNVVGTGHVVRPEIDFERLGITQAAAETWEEMALDIWQEWSGSRDCDITRSQNFAELEDLVYRSALLSGDVFAVRRFKQRSGRLLGSVVQVVEAGRVSNPHWQSDSQTLAGGIERDSDGAVIAYHVANRHAIDKGMAGAVQWTRVPAYGRTGWPIVLHIHGTRWRPDMSRYAPMLAPVIESLKQRSRYSEAELMAAVVSACFAIGMKSDDGELGAGLTEAANSTGKPDIRLTEPGLIFDLMPNESIEAFAPGRPNPQFAPFIDAIAKEVGAGTDLPVELLLKHFQASYSASRAALEMAWQFFRTERARHVTQFCQPLYEAVIAEAVGRRLLDAPNFFTSPLARRAWLGAVWMGPARPTIDPTKDATADQAYLDMGVTSLTRISAERFGMDYRVTRRRRAQDGSDEASASAAAIAPPVADDDEYDGGDDDTEEETANAD